MDRITGIIRYQRRAFWRRFSRARSLTTGHQGITLVITVVIFFKYLSLLGFAAVALALGETRLLRALLTGILLAWLFLPISTSPAGFPFRRLLHLPLSLKDLFAIRISSLFITPYSWIVIAASFAICYPLAGAARPLPAITAAILLVTMSCLIGVALGHLLSMAAWRWRLFALVTVSAITAHLLSWNDPARLLYAVTFPINLVADAALGRSPMFAVSLLLAFNLLALGVALWSFHLSLVSTAGRRSQRKRNSVLFGLPGAVGSLAAKDVCYFRTLLDPYLGLLASAIGCFYLVGSGSPSALVAWTITVVVLLPNSPLAFDSFGFESPATLDRYALMPATGATIVVAKNLAFAIVCTVQVMPILLLTSWRLGLAAGAVGLAVATSTGAAYLIWGNWMSLSLPARMRPFNFSPTTGSLPEIMAGVFFGSLPGILIISVLRSASVQPRWFVPLILILFAGLYFVVTVRSGRRFERQRQRLSLALKLT